MVGGPPWFEGEWLEATGRDLPKTVFDGFMIARTRGSEGLYVSPKISSDLGGPDDLTRDGKVLRNELW